jgi:hypothetical protein
MPQWSKGAGNFKMVLMMEESWKSHSWVVLEDDFLMMFVDFWRAHVLGSHFEMGCKNTTT